MFNCEQFLHSPAGMIFFMPHSKERAKNTKRSHKKDDQKPTGYKSSQGNMGAGRSGAENLGSEKPSNDENMGSQKAGGASKK
jgi:hypothetical protein